MKETLRQSLPIEKINRLPAQSCRAILRDDVADEYAAAYERGDRLPPITVYYDGKLKSFHLADGDRRLQAQINLGRTTCEANIRAGTMQDAILFAAKANETHGLRRSVEDKRKAVLTLLSDGEWFRRTDSWLAEQAKVSPDFVATVRATLTPPDGQPERRKGQDGRTYKARKPRREREPGDDTATERPQRNGTLVSFSWPTFDAIYGQLMRQLDVAFKPYKAHNTAEVYELRRALKDFRDGLKAAINRHRQAKD